MQHGEIIMKPNNIYDEIKMSYSDYVNYLLTKYGYAKHDYFRNENCLSKNNKITRTKEGLFCHHIDENKAILLANPNIAKLYPFSYQKANRLVYCNFIEHLLLHIKIVEESRREDENVMVGIGGVLMICQQINGCFRNVPNSGWRKDVFDIIKDRYEDYIVIMQHAKNIIENDAILKKYYSEPKLATDWEGKLIKNIYYDIYK